MAPHSSFFRGLQGELQRGGAAVLQEVLVVVEAGIRQETHLFRRQILELDEHNAGCGWKEQRTNCSKGKKRQLKWLDVFLCTSQ